MTKPLYGPLNWVETVRIGVQTACSVVLGAWIFVNRNDEARIDAGLFDYGVGLFVGGFLVALIYPQYFFVVPGGLVFGPCVLCFMNVPFELTWPIGFVLLNLLLHCSAGPAYLGSALAFGLFLFVRWSFEPQGRLAWRQFFGLTSLPPAGVEEGDIDGFGSRRSL